MMKLLFLGTLFIAYATTFLRYSFHWFQLKSKPCPTPQELEQAHLLEPNSLGTTPYLKVSLVVCCHNEAENLPQLFQSLEYQSYPIQDICFVNDHSTDQTKTLLKNYCTLHPNAHYFESALRGKKEALKCGIQHCQTNIVLLTDADCQLLSHWSSGLAYALENHSNTQLIIGGVKYHRQKSMWFENLDFASLIATTAASSYSHPILCNGANLATYKSTWLQYQNQLQNHLVSGDDIFYLQALIHDQHQIEFLKNNQTFVYTSGKQNWKEFIQQRLRWGSKTTSYSDAQTLWVALLVGLISCAQLVTLFTGQWSLFFILWSLKFIIDLNLILPFLKFTQQRYLIKYLVPFSFIYPFYILGIAMLSLFKKQTQW